MCGRALKWLHRENNTELMTCTTVLVHPILVQGCKVVTPHSHTHTHTHTFNGPLSGTTQVSQYQKGKTNLDFTEARDSGWQWHQLGHNASLHLAPDRQPHQHPTTLMVFTGRMPFLPPNQQCQSTEGKAFSLTLNQNPQTQTVLGE